MQYVDVPGTDLTVSRIAFGAEPLGGADWGQVDDRAAADAVREALDNGINLFDTADVYGLGRSEEVLSEALGASRHEVVIVTKFGVNWDEADSGGRARTYLDASPARAVEAIEGSLRRLRLDTIPVCLVHWPDPNTRQEATFDTLMDCREKGMIRHVGVSNYPPDLVEVVRKQYPVVFVENEYSLLKRDLEEHLLPLAAERGIGVLGYGALAQGLLTGKYDARTTFGEDDRRHRLDHFRGDGLKRGLQVVDRLQAVARRHDATAAQVALAWVLRQEAVSSVIAGAKNPEQVRMNASAAHIRLTADDHALLQAPIELDGEAPQ